MRPVYLLLLLIAPPALTLGLNSWVGRSAAPQPALGLVDGSLQPCPPGVECYSSTEAGSDALPALSFEGDPDDARAAMLAYLGNESGAHYLDVEGDYIHALFVRDYLKLIEDVELVLDREARLFHVRALERTNSPASGTRARVEELASDWSFVRQRLEAADADDR